MTVKSQRKIRWINDCNCKVDEFLLTKASLWKSRKPMVSIKHIYKFGNYAAVTIDGRKIHVHRLLMEYELLNNIPITFCVHHLDGNKMNDSIDNLAIMVSGAHNSHHMNGHVITDKQREMILKANHRRKGMKIQRRVKVPLDELKVFLKDGKSINWISRHYECDWATIKRRIHENPELLEAQHDTRTD
ncbi:HNH endonuclease [Levilactobacillus brevis]|uniref:HNH endonuclease n=1 Tax=Levilactobacillus brevis TaxID=1580 RepID=UPI000B34D986|nr:HNH endonuclease [Levilactobacillus brevis]